MRQEKLKYEGKEVLSKNGKEVYGGGGYSRVNFGRGKDNWRMMEGREEEARKGERQRTEVVKYVRRNVHTPF